MPGEGIAEFTPVAEASTVKPPAEAVATAEAPPSTGAPPIEPAATSDQPKPSTIQPGEAPAQQGSQLAEEAPVDAGSTPPAEEKVEVLPRLDQARLTQLWEGPNGAITLVTEAVKKGDFQTDNINEIMKALGISDQNDPKVHEELAQRKKIVDTVAALERIGNKKDTGVKKIGKYQFEITKPDGTKQIVRIQDTVEPIIQALEKIAQETTSAVSADVQPQPTDRAKRAQTILDPLKQLVEDDPNGGKYFKAPETIKTPEQEDQDFVARQAVLYIGERIDAGLPDDLFTRDENGQITGINEVKFKEFQKSLEDQDPDETIGRLTLYLGAYYDSATSPKHKSRLAALIYNELTELSPDRVKTGINNPGHFKGVFIEMLVEIKKEYGVTLDPDSFTMKHLTRDLAIALACEGKLETEGQNIVLPKTVRELAAKQKWNLSPAEEVFIKTLANQESATTSFLANSLGLSVESLTDIKTRQGYADNVVGKLLEERGERGLSEAAKSAYERVYKEATYHHVVTEEGLKKLAAKHGLSGVSGTVLILLLILGPSVFGGLGFGGGGGRQEETQ